MYSQEQHYKQNAWSDALSGCFDPIKPPMANLQGSRTPHNRSEIASPVMESNSDKGTLRQQLH
jgi:hypothetical protein